MLSCWKHGGQGRNRTADASLFRAALYQLSYLATTRVRKETMLQQLNYSNAAAVAPNSRAPNG
jgi:hypothetical protein